jgi:hypothetical protein
MGKKARPAPLDTTTTYGSRRHQGLVVFVDIVSAHDVNACSCERVSCHRKQGPASARGGRFALARQPRSAAPCASGPGAGARGAWRCSWRRSSSSSHQSDRCRYSWPGRRGAWATAWSSAAWRGCGGCGRLGRPGGATAAAASGARITRWRRRVARSAAGKRCRHRRRRAATTAGGRGAGIHAEGSYAVSAAGGGKRGPARWWLCCAKHRQCLAGAGRWGGLATVWCADPWRGPAARRCPTHSAGAHAQPPTPKRRAVRLVTLSGALVELVNSGGPGPSSGGGKGPSGGGPGPSGGGPGPSGGGGKGPSGGGGKGPSGGGKGGPSGPGPS